MAEECCGTCKFKHTLAHQGMMPVTVCRRYPPLASLIPQNIGMPATVTFWPGPSDTDYCGEWKPIGGADIRPLQSVGGSSDAST